ncbi:MAG: T9SS type A sorting domain-containing protein [Imperialibacter sp.]|uniref:T9SS type A sorting domain-containing protein n=1 Tax=Imperialibacter sp. TaxID=2038411 RepID=UPI0032EAD7A2
MKWFNKFVSIFLLAALCGGEIFAQLTTTPGTTVGISVATKVGVQVNAINQGTISNNGTLYLYNDWSNSGTYGGLGIVNLSGTSQTFAHNGQQLASLFVNGGGSKQISSSVLITEGLVLANGLIDVNPSANFVVKSTASISGASPTSYVRGKMQISGQGNQYFPIGTGSTFTPVELIKVKGNAPVVAMEAKEPHPVGQGGLGVVEISQARYWERTVVSGEMTEGKITLPTINESFIGTMNNASIVASDELGGTYESLGQQSTSGTVDNGTVTSFEDALFNFYALASEINNSREADSIALVKLYARANGDDWINKTDWLTAPIDTWHGVSVQGGRVVGINLADNNLTGRLTADLRKLSLAASLNLSNNQIGQGVPASAAQLTNLQTLNLASNRLESLPNLSTLPNIQLIDVSGNLLQFDDLEPNIGLSNFNYANQGKFGTALDSLQPVHTSFVHDLSVGGSANEYQWFRNGESVAQANSSTYAIDDLIYDNMGEYELRATSSLVPDLILASNTQKIRATASLQGRVTNADGANVANATGAALGIRPGRYDTLGSYTGGANGLFFISQLVLGDYLLYASQNNNVYIPTYHKRTIDWAFADVVNLRENTTGADITMEYLPRELTPDDGDNVVLGFLDEDFGSGKVLDRKRVQGAGVSISRSRFRAKGNEDDYELVVYIQTDENGEFEISNLADGDYRINIQYPGIPIDPASFIDFQLGGGAGLEQNRISLEALVTEESLLITKVKETGIYLSYFKDLEVYPNPADKFVTIKYEQLVKGNVVAELMDLNGNSLKTMALKNEKNYTQLLDVADVNNGIYVLRFHDQLVPGRPIITYRIIISR